MEVDSACLYMLSSDCRPPFGLQQVCVNHQALRLRPAEAYAMLLYRFREVFYDDTFLAIVMEYASQGHLSALVKRQGKLSETDARR